MIHDKEAARVNTSTRATHTASNVRNVLVRRTLVRFADAVWFLETLLGC